MEPQVGQLNKEPWWFKLKPSALSADDRAALITFIEDGSAPSRRLITLTIIASLIAAFGLITNSVATIVGAMIIEPSIGPIIGLALGLVRFDWQTKRQSLVAIFWGILLTIAVGYLAGIAPIDMGITEELTVRSQPTLLDMLVAAASGLAAGYAYVNPKVNPALAGVAVAVSLAPPLAACGIFLAHQMNEEARGAFLMFFANLICIQFATIGVFWFYRIGTSRKAKSSSNYWIQFVPYVLVCLALGGYLFLTLKDLVELSNEQRAVRSWLRKKNFPTDDMVLRIEHVGSAGRSNRCVVRILLPSSAPFPWPQLNEFHQALESQFQKSVQLTVKTIPLVESTIESD